MGCGASTVVAPPKDAAAVPVAAPGLTSSALHNSKAVFVAKSPAPSSAEPIDPRVSKIFKIIDKNNDGVLSKAEVLIALRKQPDVRTALGIEDVNERSRNSFEKAFARMDADSNATITEGELNKYMSDVLAELWGATPAIAKYPSAPRIVGATIKMVRLVDGTIDRARTLEAVFDALDVDKSGSLDLGEFRRAMDAEVGAGNSAEFFKWMDGNGDGMLTLKEWTDCVMQTEAWKDDTEFEETIKAWTSSPFWATRT